MKRIVGNLTKKHLNNNSGEGITLQPPSYQEDLQQTDLIIRVDRRGRHSGQPTNRRPGGIPANQWQETPEARGCQRENAKKLSDNFSHHIRGCFSNMAWSGNVRGCVNMRSKRSSLLIRIFFLRPGIIEQNGQLCCKYYGACAIFLSKALELQY